MVQSGDTELTFTDCKGCKDTWGQERDPGGSQARDGGRVGRAMVAGAPTLGCIRAVPLGPQFAQPPSEVGTAEVHFPVAVVANYHKRGVFKQHRLVISPFGKSEVQNGLTGLNSRRRWGSRLEGRMHSLAFSRGCLHFPYRGLLQLKTPVITLGQPDKSGSSPYFKVS